MKHCRLAVAAPARTLKLTKFLCSAFFFLLALDSSSHFVFAYAIQFIWFGFSAHPFKTRFNKTQKHSFARARLTHNSIMIYELADKWTKINFGAKRHICNWLFATTTKKTMKESKERKWARGRGRKVNIGLWAIKITSKHSLKLIENITMKFIEFRN